MVLAEVGPSGEPIATLCFSLYKNLAENKIAFFCS